jgi:PAS domain S-box-containing protein
MPERTVEELERQVEELQRSVEELKRSGAAQHDVERDLLAILTNTPAPIYLKDSELRYVLVNRRFEELAHVTTNLLRGKTDYDIFPEPVADLFRQQDEEVIRCREPREFEEAIPLPDGEFAFITVKFPVFDDDGRLRSVGGFCTDITARRAIEKKREEAERGLAQSEEKFRSVVEKSHLGVAIVNDRREYTYVNDELCRMTGYDAADIIGRDLLFTVAKESAALIEDRYTRRQAGEAVPDHYEVGFRRKDGKHRTGELRSAIFQDSSGHTNTLIQILDITERREAEEERREFDAKLQQTQKLESLGVLAGGIAHDFNNLLTAILGNVGLALLDLPPKAKVRPQLQEALSASERAADLCRQMLAYSGRGAFEVRSVNVNSLIAEMGRMLEVSISKKVVMDCDFAPMLPAILADVTQLRQVVMNLVINASEATGDQGGEVSITTGCVECDREYLAGTWLADKLPEGRYVYIDVTDTGCGMDRATMQSIFDPFFTTKFTGRGLGLAAVLGIVRGHHGAVKVTSEPGRGTTFRVLLPASEVIDQPVMTPTPGDGWTASGTVLLVDDEQPVRSVGARMLEHCGFTVVTASDGREALKIFSERAAEIVCVILDLNMPHMDGDETLRAMRSIRPEVRVVMSSGYDEQEVTKRFADRGLVGFLQKPYRYEDFTGKLRAILG